MFKLNHLLGGAALAFALVSSPMARADDEKAVSLIVKPKAGHITRTKTVIKTNFNGMDIVVNQAQKDTVKEIKENGDVVVEITDEGSTVTYGGTDHDTPAAAPRTITRDKVGKVKEYKSEDQPGFMTPEVSKLMSVVSTFILTEKAVKKDDTWQTEIENPAVKAKKITVKGTYLGIEKIDGKDYWKIKQTTEAVVDTDGSKMTYDVTEWVNPADGEAVKIEGTVKDVPTQVGPLTMQMTSKVVKADDKEIPTPKKPEAKP